MEFLSSLFLFGLVLVIPSLRRSFLPAQVDVQRSKATGRIEFFDFAKGIAIIAVILIHSIYLFVKKFPDYDPYWLDVINNFSRFAVGFFFISSGALLASRISLKKVIHIFIPYVVFCIIVGLFQNKSLDLIIGGIVRGDLLPQLYFIPVLFQFYLLFPIISKFRHKKYFLLVSLLISYFFYLLNFNYILGIPLAGQFLFLFAFGMAFSERLKSLKPIKNIDPWLIITLAYAVLQFMFPAHYYNSRYFYAPALFVVAHWLWAKAGFIRNIRIIQSFGILSLWVYLVHFSVESFFVNLLPYDFSYSVYLYILIITGLTMAGSGAVAKVLEYVYLQLLGLINKKSLHFQIR